jgi:hypothetical protein
MLSRFVTYFALTALLGACGDSGECATDADCPGTGVCSFSVCTIPAGSDGQAILDVDLPCDAAVPGDLVLNEILADPGGLDVDGDGVADSGDDEFVEVVNISGREVGIANVLISVAGSSTKQVQLGVECLPSNGARVLFGSEKGLGLVNSGATVSLLISGEVVQAHTYGGEAGQDESLTLATQLDPTSGWVKHSEISSADWSPGVCSNGNAFPDCAGGAGVDGGDATGDSTTLCGEVPEPGDLVINEVLADPGATNDANGDGVSDSSEDEFVEIVNVDLRPYELSGLTLHDNDKERFAFPSGTCVMPGETIVVFGSYDADAGSVQPGVLAYGATLSLNNDGDVIKLLDSSGIELDRMAYGKFADDGLSGNDDQSLTREVQMDASSPWVKHSEAALAAGATMSPGTCQDGNVFPDCGSAAPVSDVDSDSGTMDTVEVDVGPGCGTLVEGPGALVINEVMVDVGGEDSNCDGSSSSSQDEFVELVNISDGALDLSGVELWTGEGDSLDLIHTFGAWCLEARRGVVLFGGGEPNLCEKESSIGLADKGLSLNNSNGHVVMLKDSSGTEVNSFTYDSVPKGESWARSPEGTGEFALHSESSACGAVIEGEYCGPSAEGCTPACSQEFSPGACLDGSPLPSCL